jgi:hypothetical protein
MASAEIVGARFETPGRLDPPEDFDLDAAYRAIHGLTTALSWILTAVENLEQQHERVDAANSNHRRPSL